MNESTVIRRFFMISLGLHSFLLLFRSGIMPPKFGLRTIEVEVVNLPQNPPDEPKNSPPQRPDIPRPHYRPQTEAQPEPQAPKSLVPRLFTPSLPAPVQEKWVSPAAAVMPEEFKTNHKIDTNNIPTATALNLSQTYQGGINSPAAVGVATGGKALSGAASGKIGGTGISGAGVGRGNLEGAGIDTGAGELLAFQDMVRRRVEKHKTYPLNARKRFLEGNVALKFLLDKDGLVSNVQIIKSSGYPVLDTAAMDAIRAAAPFSPPPAKYKQNLLWLEIILSFSLIG